ncbi:MAG TPA: hypothetical protein VLH39_00315, partial [Magnetospirillaceae bacterium]|nr:hypothetical protein [Magnetospirillaceae bacterium]
MPSFTGSLANGVGVCGLDTDGSRKPGLPARIGIVLASLALVSAVIVGSALASGPDAGFPASAGRLLTRPLGWAALSLPAFLLTAATVLFLPGYRKDLLILLSGAPLPFLVLVFLSRFLADPSAWYEDFPLLEALGLPGTTALAVLAFFLPISLLVRPINSPLGSGDLEEGQIDDAEGPVPEMPSARPGALDAAAEGPVTGMPSARPGARETAA